MSELLDKRYLKHLSDRPGTPGICVVCIDRINKEAFTDTCAHSFCFACISRWAEVNAVCPLCKSKFKNIIHNVKSEAQYDIHKVNKPTEDHRIFTLFQYIPSATINTHQPTPLDLPSWGPFPELRNSTSLPVSTTRRFYTRIPRTQIYTLNLRPLESPSYRGRLRQASPEFFRRNEAQIHRLIPWIIRDLEAIKTVSGFGYAVNEVSDIIVTTLPYQRIQGQHMRSLIQPFLARYTVHFLRELYLFAISPLDMIGYDREVEYRSSNRAMNPRRIMMQFGIDLDDADNEVVEFAYRPDAEIPSITLSPTVQTVPEPVPIDDSEDDCVVITTITRNQNLSRDVVVISDSDDGTSQHTAEFSSIPVASDRRSSRREPQASNNGRITNGNTASTSRPDRIIPTTERSRVERKRPITSKLRSASTNGPSTSRAAARENSDESGSDEDDRNWQVGKVRSYVTRKKQKTKRNLANNDTTGSSSDESDENEGNWESSKMKSYLKRKKLKAQNDIKQSEAMKRIRTKTPNTTKPTAGAVPESTASSSSQPERPKIRLRSVVGKVINHRREGMEPETTSRYSGLRKRKLTNYVFGSDSSD